MSKQTTDKKPAVPATRVEVKTKPVADGNRVIKVLVAENPKKPGSASRIRFDAYRDGMTVAEALEAGIRRADFRWDAERGFIEIVDPS